MTSSVESSTGRLGVLGIGLIMEEVGKGARLVFRYPAAPPPSFLDRHINAAEGESGHHNPRGNMKPPKNDMGDPPESGKSSASCDSINLFFDLPAKVLSKLFRPKRPLCGQPLTLNVSGTTFCCRAELFDSQPSTIGGGDGSNHPLVLFSVIVALAPLAQNSSHEGGGQPDLQYTHRHFVFGDTSPRERDAEMSSNSNRSDSAFRTIRSVHQNLARLCRVLIREEYRCRFVSRQCNILLRIRTDYKLSLMGSMTSQASGSDGGGNNNSVAGGDANTSKKNEGAGNPSLSPKSSTKMKDPTSKSKAAVSDDLKGTHISQMHRREYVQNLIDIMLAASPPAEYSQSPDDEDDFDESDQHGNLARELAQIFHLMSSSDGVSTNNILAHANAQSGVVYINRHIALPLEPVGEVSSHHHNEVTVPAKQQHLQPYQTILFPNSSPANVLKGSVDGGLAEMAPSPPMSQSLRRVLPHIQPHKSLHETARENGLPLQHVMNVANLLLHSGICIAVMPIQRNNRYVCADGVVPKMSSLALPFWQMFVARCRNVEFHWGGGSTPGKRATDGGVTMQRKRNVTIGAPQIFVVVSALTTKMDNSSMLPTLGEAIDMLSGVDETNHATAHDRDGTDGVADIVYSMTVFLIANKVIVESQS